MQGQNNIDADASANCDQGILRKIFKRKITFGKKIQKKKKISLRKIIQRKIIQRKVSLRNMDVASIFLTVALVIETFSTYFV